MILILSNGFDKPTDSVAKWLLHKQAPFIRLNSEDLIDTEKGTFFGINGPNDSPLEVGGRVIEPESIQVVWYRRWYGYKTFKLKPVEHRDKLIAEVIDQYNTAFYYLVNRLGHKKWLSHPFQTAHHNKLHTLLLARQAGLDTPDTIIATKKEQLEAFIKTYPAGAIMKPISDMRTYVFPDGRVWRAFPEKITADLLEDIPDTFPPTLFQECIDREIEARVFYLDGKCYATGMFIEGVLDPKLSMGKNENIKMVPFNLPEPVNQGIDRLMKSLNLLTGSMDVIKTVDGRYTFIEVNPVGQFLGYGQKAGYNLEKDVADWLIAQTQ